MRLLFDHSVTSPLRRLLTGHEIILARERGWDQLVNGKLIAAAEAAGFEGLVACDKHLRREQNLTRQHISIVVLPTNIWPHLQPYLNQIAAMIDRAGPGAYLELHLSRPTLLRRAPPDRGA